MGCVYVCVCVVMQGNECRVRKWIVQEEDRPGGCGGEVGRMHGEQASSSRESARGRQQAGHLGRRAGDSRASQVRCQVSAGVRVPAHPSLQSFLPGPGRVPFLTVLALLCPPPLLHHPFTHGHLSYGTASLRASISTRISQTTLTSTCNCLVFMTCAKHIQ